ncbi:aliphatic sulfonate ABC transporter substrate-binding protein [Gloeothece verrucosa]|uniref:Putative aliphatic sulfonates-binding protein n=1 Tax=Gloeothece verrucosa (strain PCC 7822) TaxID=497965 RepID=E0UIV2_GLOV7|nr:aliphatic sulfonate ABC transporter substrate-binding protein [Gloeothece verrucosa]ADN13411.1 aliphatic sulfonates family ABC transporter, periplasmic ligand-binding protein [Gloeothece verrucosa PCC 7822]
MKKNKQRYQKYKRLKFPHLPNWLLEITLIFCLSILGSCTHPEIGQTSNHPKIIRLDYAYYNPVSLVLKNKGWLEEDLQKSQVKIEWVLSQGSNKALEFLNSRSVDFGSTAGAAALIGKANGNPIKSIYVYSKPEWTALVTQSNSKIRSVTDLKGKRVAATRGTDPYIFLLRALNEFGLSEKDIELIQLQHADGRAALEKGDVDAWAGLDPQMAKTELENGSHLFFRKPEYNSYGVLNVREEFAKQYPDSVEQVLKSYEKARQWARENPQELKQILIKESNLSDAVAAKQLERTDLSNPNIGPAQKEVIIAAGDVLKKSGVIAPSVDVVATVNELIDPQFVEKIASK